MEYPTNWLVSHPISAGGHKTNITCLPDPKTSNCQVSRLLNVSHHKQPVLRTTLIPCPQHPLGNNPRPPRNNQKLHGSRNPPYPPRNLRSSLSTQLRLPKQYVVPTQRASSNSLLLVHDEWRSTDRRRAASLLFHTHQIRPSEILASDLHRVWLFQCALGSLCVALYAG